MQISHWQALIKLNSKKLLGKQKQAARVIFNQYIFLNFGPLLKTLTGLNAYQINLLQVLQVVHAHYKNKLMPLDVRISVSNNKS